VYFVEDGVPNFLLTHDMVADGRQSLVGRTVAAIVAVPQIYDLVQRLAGARRLYEPVRGVLAEAEGMLVLDAGAGTGILETLLPESAGYIWLDPDPQKLQGFRRKSQAPAVLGDATKLPLRDQSVDWVVSAFMSHHLDDAELGRMLDECRRVARQRFCFLDAVSTAAWRSRLLWRYDRGRHPRAAETLRRELAARFRILTDQEVPLLHRCLLVTAE
jgi:ubiquinone/menaquinone biosynthesis C-methylase UbiE